MMKPQEIWGDVEKVKEEFFKDYSFESWSDGLNSTEKKNLGRVVRLLNVCDELESNNLKEGWELFYFINQLVKELLSDQYEIVGTRNNSYSIRRVKQND